jgi:hypothetical protein
MVDETVAPNPNEPAEQTSEAAGKQDDVLDSLLNEWEEGEKPEPVQAKPAAPQSPQRDPLVEELYQRQAAEDFEKTVNEFIGDVGEDKTSAAAVRRWLNGIASENPKVNQAYAKRFRNPDLWKKTFGGLVNQFKEDHNITDSGPEPSNDDVASAQAYVQGSSTKEVPKEPISNEKLAGLSDKEFNEMMSKEYGI